MDAKKFKRLLSDFLDNRLSLPERKLFQKWYDSFGESEEGVPELGSQAHADRLGEELFQRIQSAIQPEEQQPPVKQLFPWRKMIAAVVIVIAGSFLWWYTASDRPQEPAAVPSPQLVFHQLHTGVSEVRKFILPDSSVIHLNANSTIRVPERFAQGDRTVYLEEGEVFFDVAKDNARPFIIQSPALAVRVLGTSFNIKAYRKLKDVTIAVRSGKVQVQDTASRLLGELTANQGMVYHKGNGLAAVSTVDGQQSQSWTTGTVHLEKAGFDELALAIFNLYGVTLKNEDPKARNYRYNLSIRSDRSLEETIDLICDIHKNNYRRKANEVIIYP